MIGVVTPVGGKSKGYRNALATFGKQLAVERIRLFSRGEPGILADRPGAACIHRRLRAANERFEAGHGVGVFQLTDVGRRVEWFDVDPFRGVLY